MWSVVRDDPIHYTPPQRDTHCNVTTQTVCVEVAPALAVKRLEAHSHTLWLESLSASQKLLRVLSFPTSNSEKPTDSGANESRTGDLRVTDVSSLHSEFDVGNDKSLNGVV